MYDLSTIQRMNAEAEAKYQRKVGKVYALLDEMLCQWDNDDVGEVDAFLTTWAERLAR